MVALKDFYNGPCGPVYDRLLRLNQVDYHLSLLNTYINRFSAPNNLETLVLAGIIGKCISLYGKLNMLGSNIFILL